MKIKAVFAFLALATLSSCYYDNKEELYQNFPQDCVTSGLTYTNDISTMISDNCVQCHSASGGQFPFLETYQEVRSNEIEVVFRITKSVGDPLVMPQGGPMPKCSIDQILAWYADGAPE